jgi:predicted N-acyltransferase
VPTFSAHHISHPGLEAAVRDFLARERPAMLAEIEALGEASPFRQDNEPA